MLAANMYVQLQVLVIFCNSCCGVLVVFSNHGNISLLLVCAGKVVRNTI